MHTKLRCCGFGTAGAGIWAAALLLTHRNRIWLVLSLLPSEKGTGERGGAGTAFTTPADERASAQLAQQTSQSRTALGSAVEAQLPSPANTFTLNDPRLLSASPEISPGTSQVSCWLVPTPHANPARLQLHNDVSGSAVKPRNNKQLLSWAGAKIFRHPRLC